MASIAEKFNYNPTYVSRLFKQITDTSLCQYIKTTRLDQAMTLLKTTNMSVQNISRATGFDSVQYFSLVFRKRFGMAPNALRHTGNEK